MIRVLVVDDQRLVREGVVAILEADPGIDVVGEAADGAEAARLARTLAVDVILMDIQMPGTDGVEGTRLAIGVRPEVRVVMLTLFDLDEHVLAALRAGASGFLLKSATPAELLAAIHGAHRGEQLFAPSVTRRLVESYVRRPGATDGVPESLSALTPRELEVFQLIGRGLSNAEIAAELVLSATTVKTHVARILDKLDLRDRVQVVVVAYESGMLVAGE